MKSPILCILTATFASTAFAAPETYVIEQNHTKPRFEYSHLGYSQQSSRFDTVTGKITLDRAAHTGAVEVSIDATSINTGSTLFNGHIQGEDFFDTAHFPTISYHADKMIFEGDKPVSVEGNLTIKGISKPVTLTIASVLCMPHPMLKKDACGATATAKIKRSDFNMGKYAPYVSDEVTLTIPVESLKQ